jgi:hypothetical protein
MDEEARTEQNMKVADWIRQKCGEEAQCPSCKNNVPRYEILNTVAMPFVGDDGRYLAASLPLVPVMCLHCYGVQLIAAKLIGVAPPDGLPTT